MATPNYYDLLQVTRRAHPDVIRASYIALHKLHDLNRPENKRFAQNINEAFRVLSRPDLRKEYDASLSHKGTGEIIGSFRKLEQIAEGSFGKTFKGKHVRLGELVCMKDCANVRPEYYPMLEEEACAMWNLSHYEIPAIRDLVPSADGSPVLIMSYIPGDTLENWIKKIGPMNPEAVAIITERALNALMYIHYRDIVHGDFKPQNIIIQPDQHTISLVDFGLSVTKAHTGPSPKGYTPLFAPPEEVAGLKLLPQSDFYSLGMTMIYALTGGDEHLIKAKHVPSATPEPLCEFINKLIVRDVLARPHWHDINLCEEIHKVRIQSFGRAHTGMESIPGL